MTVLVIYLHILDLRELFEIQIDQVDDVEVLAFGGTCTCQVNVRDAIVYFQIAVAGKAVIDSDPAIGIPFGRTWTFEELIERGFINYI